MILRNHSTALTALYTAARFSCSVFGHLVQIRAVHARTTSLHLLDPLLWSSPGDLPWDRFKIKVCLALAGVEESVQDEFQILQNELIYALKSLKPLQGPSLFNVFQSIHLLPHRVIQNVPNTACTWGVPSTRGFHRGYRIGCSLGSCAQRGR
jgi:hypothetical protein